MVKGGGPFGIRTQDLIGYEPSVLTTKLKAQGDNMKEIIIAELLNIYNTLNKVPTKNEFIKFNTTQISFRKIIKEFSSYNDLIEAAKLKPNRVQELYKCLCTECNTEFNKPRYRYNEERNFCSKKCSMTFLNREQNPNPKKNRNTICENCTIEFCKTKDQERTICSKLCLMEHFMKNKIMYTAIKRERIK